MYYYYRFKVKNIYRTSWLNMSKITIQQLEKLCKEVEKAYGKYEIEYKISDVRV